MRFATMAEEALHFAYRGAREYEGMTGDPRTRDAFFDGLLSTSLKLQTKTHLLRAYGSAFVCQDGNCTVCSWYSLLFHCHGGFVC